VTHIAPDHTRVAEDAAPVDELRARVAELEEEVRRLRLDLWRSRDATIGATATAGSYRARNTELEMIVGQLRTEVTRLAAAAAARRSSTTTARLGRVVRNPSILVRRLLRS
jgi:uncharacterized small protein (DUF1192 family)